MHFTNLGTLIDHKNDEEAEEFRKIGNIQYTLKNYYDALIWYNRFISYASTKKNLALGYANRSAVYLQLELYDECLMNIELARQNDYPADKIDKLNEREQKCKNLKFKGRHNKNPDPREFFKLSYLANKKIPWIVDCLELHTTKKYGRGIYATKNLKPGDIICIEEPAIHLFDRAEYFKHCSNCYKTSMMNLIPCSRTATMMFCSTDCMKEFHAKFVDIDLAMNHDMKLLSEIAAPFGGYKELDEFITKTDLKNLRKTIFDYDFSDPNDPDYRKNLMTCFLSLNTLDGIDIDDQTINIFKHVSKKTALHVIKLLVSNKEGDTYIEEFLGSTFNDGIRVSLFESLINHSCLKNINSCLVDNKLVTYVFRPIKAGEQIFTSYIDKHTENNHKDQLLKQFGFKCDCKECIDNSFKPLQAILPMPPHMYMSRKDFNEAKRFLINCWRTLSTTKDHQQIYNNELHANQIMGILGYYATFPCQKFPLLSA